MTDQEKQKKTIRGLKCIAGMNEMKVNPCIGCGYDDCETYAICVGCVANDALALLKAQEQEINRLKHHIDCEAAEKNGAGCLGYGRGINDDEPCETCKKCEKQVSYGEE